MDYLQHKIFAEHYKAAKLFFKNAELKNDGYYYNLVASNLFCALCFEAYLNHLGNIEIQNWIAWDLQEKPNIKDKLSKISNKLNFKIDYTNKPYSIITPLFDYRNLVVHGKTQIVTKEIHNPQNNSKACMLTLSSDIEKFCTFNKTKINLKLIQEIIETLNEKSNSSLPKSRLWNLANGSYQIKST